jgi:hypothetical protein
MSITAIMIMKTQAKTLSSFFSITSSVRYCSFLCREKRESDNKKDQEAFRQTSEVR